MYIFLDDVLVYKHYKYNSGGQRLWRIDLSPDAELCDMSAGDNDVIFVCLENKVVVYDRNGHQISTLSSTEKLVEPSGVVVNKSGEFVVNTKFSSVKSLVDLGFLLCELSLYKNRRLSVCETSSTKRFVYKV